LSSVQTGRIGIAALWWGGALRGGMTMDTNLSASETFNVRRDDAIKLIYLHKNIWVWFKVNELRYRYIKATRKSVVDLLRDDLGVNDTVTIRRVVGNHTNLFIGE
jgi:hypothetical protein